MLGNFSFCNPTKLYFGNESLNDLNRELPKYGKNVAEISGVMPNPTVDKLYEGVEIARKHQADLLLAVGGGSVCDYAKAVSVSVNCEEDPWEKYYLRFEEPSCKTLPVGCVLTMVGTGSEMNAGAVITNPHTSEDRSCICGRKDYAQVCHLKSEIYADSAPLPDGIWDLRYF